MTKQEFESDVNPLTLICSINPETGKCLFDFYDGWNNEHWLEMIKKDFPEMINFTKLNRAAIKLRAKEAFNYDISDEDIINTFAFITQVKTI